MRSHKGFTLIELAFTISIIGLLAAVFLPKMGTMLAWEKQQSEQLLIDNMASRFTEGVLSSKTIPDQTTWNMFISKYAGISPADVLVNNFGKKRIYVFPDNFFAPTSTLPFDQTANSSSSVFLNTLPLNARVMIISDTSNLNSQILTNSGVLTSASFDSIWSQNVASPSFIAELRESSSLEISRINLSSVFKDIVINNNDTANVANITIDGVPLAKHQVQTLATFQAWVIKNSQLFLYDSLGVVAYQHTVSQPVSFVYNGVWGGNLGGVGTVTGGGTGTSAVIGTGFSTTNSGLFTNWGANPTCSPTGTVYTLTVDVQNQNEDWLIYAGVGGNPTYLGKVKSGRIKTFNVSECELIFAVPKGNGSTNIYAFYMPHNNYTLLIP